MSEEILKALMELFALVTKQDGGTIISEREYVSDFLKKQLTRDSVSEYLALFDEQAGSLISERSGNEASAPTVKDSVKILGICKKINRTLNQEQKVVALMRLFELVNADRRFTPQRMNIITTVAEVFKIAPAEFSAIEQFVRNDEPGNLINQSILLLTRENLTVSSGNSPSGGYEDILIIILRIASVDLYFIKYLADDQLFLNGLPVRSGNICTFAKGASIKSKHGNPIYYSDISSRFLSDLSISRISFTASNLSYSFSSGQTAIDNISFSVVERNLIGILGASGSGKTTLLNLISGIQRPTKGKTIINGLDVYADSAKLEGVFGYVPQDDLLIEDLTVYENLYFAARQCFSSKNRDELGDLVNRTLSNLGLLEKSNLKVGSPDNKVISGGQRKRLNIALELIREPLVLFLDEPTSGLSSRDSENLMDLLRDLTLKGKLIFTVIHQPSSEIFKMFDKVIILDQKGCMAYFGNPVDSVIYFKTIDAQINSEVGECPSCGNVNPEIIFNIIESQVVDEFGKYTEKRKVQPEEWAELFSSRYSLPAPPEIKEPPVSNLQRPGISRQFMIYLKRDLKSKIANHQYVLLTLLEAPLLAFILSFIIRYIPDPESKTYIFAENENIPVYIFMSLIVALFIGLTISAEEIFRDRKILKREHFLNLSRTSYLLSKVCVLILISALQTSLFLIIANPILALKGMFFRYWLALWATAFCANMLGLNISASFNSAITIYIVIPVLIIPMMVLSGAMFPFDKLNRIVGNIEKVPVIAELMPTRWTYEALMVAQFKDNRYSRIEYTKGKETYFQLQKIISQAEFNKVYRLRELQDALSTTVNEYNSLPDNSQNPDKKGGYGKTAGFSRLKLLENELTRLSASGEFPVYRYLTDLNPEKFNLQTADCVKAYLDRLDVFFSRISNSASERRDRFYNLNEARLRKFEKEYYNYKLFEIVTKPYERNKLLIHNNLIIQNTDPVYLDPDSKGFLDFRTHFFAPVKYIFGFRTDTYVFNILIVLVSTLILYAALYFELLGKAVRFIDNFKFRKQLRSC